MHHTLKVANYQVCLLFHIIHNICPIWLSLNINISGSIWHVVHYHIKALDLRRLVIEFAEVAFTKSEMVSSFLLSLLPSDSLSPSKGIRHVVLLHPQISHISSPESSIVLQ